MASPAPLPPQRLEPDVVTAADVLVKHQGPFFDGTVDRCQCRQIVRSGQEWAEHVDALLKDIT